MLTARIKSKTAILTATLLFTSLTYAQENRPNISAHANAAAFRAAIKANTVEEKSTPGDLSKIPSYVVYEMIFSDALRETNRSTLFSVKDLELIQAAPVSGDRGFVLKERAAFAILCEMLNADSTETGVLSAATFFDESREDLVDDLNAHYEQLVGRLDETTKRYVANKMAEYSTTATFTNSTLKMVGFASESVEGARLMLSSGCERLKQQIPDTELRTVTMQDRVNSNPPVVINQNRK